MCSSDLGDGGPEPHAAAGGDGQRGELAFRLEQREVVRLVHLHYLGLNYPLGGEQTDATTGFNDMLVSDEVTIVGERKAGAGGGRLGFNDGRSWLFITWAATPCEVATRAPAAAPRCL